MAGQITPVDPKGDTEALGAANDVLGGNFLSRINMDLREAKGWSLRDLAAASGVSMRTVHSIEAGTGKGAASCVTMARLADALHVPRGWLAFGG